MSRSHRAADDGDDDECVDDDDAESVESGTARRQRKGPNGEHVVNGAFWHR